MKLSHRPARVDDFAAFFNGFHNRDPALYDILVHEWRVFLKHSPNLSMVVEDGERDAGDRLVGIAQTVFVSDAFVEYVHTGLPPHVNIAASLPMPDGSSPLLSADQICAANSGPGLNALTTRWGWRNDARGLEASREVRSYLDRAYPLYYLGYRYKHILITAYGDWPYESLVRSGFTLLTDYSAFYRDNTRPLRRRKITPISCTPAGTWLARKRAATSAACSITRRPGSSSNRTSRSLSGPRYSATATEFASWLFIGLDGVKKRWESIYDRVYEVDPSLIPGIAAGKRGPEKRRRLLAHIREHLEEVRPYCAAGA